MSLLTMRKLVPNFSAVCHKGLVKIRAVYLLVRRCLTTFAPMTGIICRQTFRKTSVCGVPSGPFMLCKSAVICTNSEVDIPSYLRQSQATVRRDLYEDCVPKLPTACGESAFAANGQIAPGFGTVPIERGEGGRAPVIPYSLEGPRQPEHYPTVPMNGNITLIRMCVQC